MVFIELILLSTSFSFAGNLQDVDLRNLYPPVRSQGDVGNCYAQAGADIVTAYLRSHKTKKFKDISDSFVSPSALSICANIKNLNTGFQNAKKSHNLYQSSEYQKTIDSIKTTGELLLKNLPCSGYGENRNCANEPYNDDVYLKYSAEFVRLCRLINLGDAECSERFLFPIPKEDPYGGQVKSPISAYVYKADSKVDGGYIKESIENALNACGVCLQQEFKEGDVQLFREFETAVNAYSRNEKSENNLSCAQNTDLFSQRGEMRQLNKTLKRLELDRLQQHPAITLFQKKCSKNAETKDIVSKLKKETIEKDQVAGTIKKISALLAAKIPVGISYHASVLAAKQSITDLHASSIVGQRTTDGKLYFIVRNSWGKDQCIKDLAIIKPSRFQCDSGDYIIDSTLLMEQATEISYIQD